MTMRILNMAQVTAHGNEEGRRIVAQIMEAGLQAADPYRNACRLLVREGNLLKVGNPLFEGENDPSSGVSVYDLNEIENIYIVGSGKGVQRAVKALEEALGDRLTGGCVIAKHGDPLILKRVNVYYGAHPVPDEGCVEGCRAVVELSRHVTEKDLVFTVIGNGTSSLMTLPAENIPLEEVKELTRMMQIERGVTTVELNVIRNHIDLLKGGKLSRLFSKAQCVHIVMADANHHVTQLPRHDYYGLLKQNVWLHNLPEASTFHQAIEVLHKYDAWNACPESIRRYLLSGTEAEETVKYEEFCNWRFRVFGIMPDDQHFLPAAERAAKALGLECHVLTPFLQAEAKECAKVYMALARSIADGKQPFSAPVVLLSSGEMLVTVEKGGGVGGRNQEFVVQCAIEIDGIRQIVVGSADSDGTDGPGHFQYEGAPSCLGGGIVDGLTAAAAREKQIDLRNALRSHGTSEPLWRLNCGLHMEQNISLNDITVIYIGI